MALDDDYEDIVAAAFPASKPKSPPLMKSVRGAERLKGVQPDLLNHWNNLQSEFSRAGLSPVIKSGFRTAEQQNSLHRRGYPTKGNDGYINISPHQKGRALDISFARPQKAKGRQVIADYAKRAGLHVPLDEPWHLSLPKQDEYDDIISAAVSKTKTAASLAPLADAPDADPYDDIVAAAIQPTKRTTPRQTIGSDLNPQRPITAGRGAGVPQQAQGGGALRQLDDPEAARVLKAQQQVGAQDRLRSRLSPNALGSGDARRAATLASNEKQDEQQRQHDAPTVNRLTTRYRQLIRQAGRVGVGPTQWMQEALAKGEAGWLELAAAGVRGLSPAMAVTAALTGGREKSANALKLHAEALQRAAVEEGADRNDVSKLVQDVVGGTIATAPEMAAMSVGLPAPAAFGMGSAARSVGRNERLPEVAKAGQHGMATGAAFEAPGALGITSRLGRGATVGAATTGIELASGVPLNQALTTGGTNALMAGATKGHSRKAAEVATETRTPIPDIDATLAAREQAVKPHFLRDEAGNPVARILNPDEVAQGAKPKVRPIHQADTQVRNEAGRFTATEQSASKPATPPPAIEPVMPAAQPAPTETTAPSFGSEQVVPQRATTASMPEAAKPIETKPAATLQEPAANVREVAQLDIGNRPTSQPRKETPTNDPTTALRTDTPSVATTVGAAQSETASTVKPERVQGERQLPKSLEAAGLPAGTERFYDVKSNVESRNKARELIKQRGVEEASNWVRSDEKPSAEQSATALELIEGLAAEAYKETNPDLRAAKIAQAGELANVMSTRSTDIAQSLQYLSTLAKESPEGALYYAERAVRRNNPDAKLTTEQREGVFDVASRLKTTETELAETKAKLASANQQLAERRTPPRQSQVTKHLRDWADQAERDARARLAARTGVSGPEAGATTIPADIADYAVIGAAKLARGTANLAEWSGQMVREFGEGIKPRLQEIRAAAEKLFDEQSRLGKRKKVVDEVVRLGAEQQAESRLVEEAQRFATGISRTDFQRQVRKRYGLTPEQANDLTAKAYKLYSEANRGLREGTKERAVLKDEPNAPPERVQELVKQRDELMKQRGKERRELLALTRRLEEGMPSIPSRLNNQFRGIIVSALQTASRNVTSQTMRAGVESLTDVFELALVKAKRKTGMKIKEGDVDPNTRMLDTLKSSAYLLQRNKRVVEGILDEFPVEYEKMFRRFSSDVELPQSKATKGIHKGLDRVDKIVEIANTPNRFQEFLGRRAVFRGVLEARLRAKGVDLNEAVRRGEQGAISRDDIEAAVNSALKVTFADSPVYGTKADAFIKLTASIPAPINPLTFSRFLYNGAKFALEYQPTTAVRGAYRTLKGQPGAARDYAKAAVGTALLTTGIGIYDAMHKEESEWYLLTNPLTGNEFDIRPFQPFASYVFLAHFLRMKRKGKPITSARAGMMGQLGTYAEGLTGLSSYPNPALETAKRVTVDDWDGALNQVKRLGGQTVAALLTPLKTPEQILQQFDKEEAVQRDTKERPFIDPIINAIPIARKSLKPRLGRQSGKPLIQPSPLLQPLGIREVDPNSKFINRKTITDPLIAKYRSKRLSDAELKRLVSKGVLTEAEGGWETVDKDTGKTVQHAGSIERQGKMSVQEVEFSNRKPQDAFDTYLKYTPTQRERVRKIMQEKAWALLHSHTMEGDSATRERKRMKLQQQFDDLGIQPKKSGTVGGLRSTIQSAFA